MPVLNEFYVNFGKFGVAIGMFLIGLFMNFISKVFNIKESNNLEYIFSFIYLFLYFFWKVTFFIIWSFNSILYIFNIFQLYHVIFFKKVKMKKILCFRNSRLGDYLISLPSLKLKQENNDSKIYYLSDKSDFYKSLHLLKKIKL